MNNMVKKIYQFKERLLRRQLSTEGRSGVVLDDAGLSFAIIQYRSQGKPILADFGYLPQVSGADRSLVLQKMVKQHGLNKYYCSTCAQPGRYRILMLERPGNVPEDELLPAVRWRVKELIDFSLDDAILDVFSLPGQGMQQRNLNVVVAKRSDLEPRVRELQIAGCILDSIDIVEMAIRNITLLMPEDDQGSAVIYLGENSGRIVITRKGGLYLSRVVDIGMGHLRVEEDDSGLRMEREDLISAQHMQSLLERYALEMQRSLDYYESHFPVPPIKQVLLTPVGDLNSTMESYLASVMRLPVKVIDLNDILECSDIIDRNMQEKCLLAIGVALRDVSEHLSSSQPVAAVG